MVNRKEEGEASIFVELSDSQIKVYNGAGKTLLAKGEVKSGAWTRIWDCFDKEGIYLRECD